MVTPGLEAHGLVVGTEHVHHLTCVRPFHGGVGARMWSGCASCKGTAEAAERPEMKEDLGFAPVKHEFAVSVARLRMAECRAPAVAGVFARHQLSGL
jgi:hypothetical protein